MNLPKNLFFIRVPLWIKEIDINLSFWLGLNSLPMSCEESDPKNRFYLTSGDLSKLGQKSPKFDFQSQFYMSKIILIIFIKVNYYPDSYLVISVPNIILEELKIFGIFFNSLFSKMGPNFCWLLCNTVRKNGFWVAATTEITSLKPLTILTF